MVEEKKKAEETNKYIESTFWYLGFSFWSVEYYYDTMSYILLRGRPRIRTDGRTYVRWEIYRSSTLLIRGVGIFKPQHLVFLPRPLDGDEVAVRVIC